MRADGLYRMRLSTPHNIERHLPMIRAYASRCIHVTEFGVERGWSTSALLASGARHVRSYDLVRREEVSLLEGIAIVEGVDFKFIQADTREVDIEPTDLLFIDTDHTFEQVDAELARSIGQVGRFLVFHDVETFPEIGPAIAKHCSALEWVQREWVKDQHGLLVLERIPV